MSNHVVRRYASMDKLSSLPLRVYLVDDEPDHLKLITRSINRICTHADVTTAGDGATALHALQEMELSPDLILLDLNMPGLNGLEVLLRLKSNETLKNVPVVILTSSTLLADSEMAYEIGANGYICKSTYQRDLPIVIDSVHRHWAVM